MLLTGLAAEWSKKRTSPSAPPLSTRRWFTRLKAQQVAPPAWESASAASSAGLQVFTSHTMRRPEACAAATQRVLKEELATPQTAPSALVSRRSICPFSTEWTISSPLAEPLAT